MEESSEVYSEPPPQEEEGRTLLWEDGMALEEKPIVTDVWRFRLRRSWTATRFPSSKAGQSKDPPTHPELLITFLAHHPHVNHQPIISRQLKEASYVK